MKTRFLALLAVVCLLATSLAVALPAVAEDEPVKLTAIVSNHTITKDLNEFEWLQAMEDAAGIDVEWQCIWSDWSTLKSTLFASMDLPDFFFCGGTLSLSDVINNRELFVPLNDYIAASTNIAPLYEADPYMGQKTTLEDGSIYTLTNRLPCRPYTATGVFINQTWLDTLNLAMPTTLDELLEVLIAMKEGDPNGNGQADEIPWVGASGATDWLMGSFGVAESRYALMYDEEGALQYIYTTEAYKKAVEFETKAFAAGVIDPEIFTQDWSVAYALSQQETEVVGLNDAWTISAISGPVNKADYTTMPILKPSAEYDGPLAWPGHPAYLVYNHDVVFAMTIACDEAKREPLFGFIDSLYTNENSLRQWGGDGVIFNDDGTVDVTVTVEGMS
ncbi:MAG: extracellular solute-binding protein, partial [Clostridia bacterium]|nr:extracellular solute-binding protein [Clostridia bacterium]